MPVLYEFDAQRGVVRTRCVGDVGFEEVIAHFRELEGDAALPARLDVLLDLTALESVPESDQLRSVAGEVEQFQKRVEWGACAVVASSDLLFGMSRVFQAFAEVHFTDASVFRELPEAERWLASRRPPA